MTQNRIFHIIISFLVIIALGSYYLGKISSYNEVNNMEVIRQEYSIIGNFRVKDFKRKISEDYILIDIRTPGEIAEGYIEGLDLEIDYYEDSFISEIKKLDNTKKYLIYCRSGSRTRDTLSLMQNLGFKDVHDLIGGIGAWEKAGEKFVK